MGFDAAFAPDRTASDGLWRDENGMALRLHVDFITRLRDVQMMDLEKGPRTLHPVGRRQRQAYWTSLAQSAHPHCFWARTSHEVHLYDVRAESMPVSASSCT